jgi:hypothetical protein
MVYSLHLANWVLATISVCLLARHAPAPLGKKHCFSFRIQSTDFIIRGKYYGLAAAIGKVGAFSGQYAFVRVGNLAPASDTTGIISTQYQFWLGGSLALFSCFLALLLPNIDQEVVVEEDVRFRRYLEDHGYDTSTMGIDHPVPITTAKEDEPHFINEQPDRKTE